jgi:hypothetical protein
VIVVDTGTPFWLTRLQHALFRSEEIVGGVQRHGAKARIRDIDMPLEQLLAPGMVSHEQSAHW